MGINNVQIPLKKTNGKLSSLTEVTSEQSKKFIKTPIGEVKSLGKRYMYSLSTNIKLAYLLIAV